MQICFWAEVQITAFPLRCKLLEISDSFCFVASPRTGPSAQKIMIECNSLAFMQSNAGCPTTLEAVALRVSWGLRPVLRMSKLEWQGTAKSPLLGTSPASVLFLQSGERIPGPWPWLAFLRGVLVSDRSAFCKGPDSEYLRLCRPYGLCHTYLTLPL